MNLHGDERKNRQYVCPEALFSKKGGNMQFVAYKI